MSYHIECQKLSFAYPGKRVLNSLDCQVDQGEKVAILGQSGCGKTSFLRLIAGLEKPSGGRVLLRGQEVACENLCLTPHQRRLGYVFQNFALFEKISVEKNIHYACKTTEDYKEANHLVEMMNLSSHLQKKPYQLSGGEKQKVALVRSLALKPDIILMDEPFSSIDPNQTQFLIEEIKKLFNTLEITSVMVTHSKEEASLFADRIIELQA